MVEVKKNDGKKKGKGAEAESPSLPAKKGKRGDRLRGSDSTSKDTTIKLQKVESDNLSDEFDMKIKKKTDRGGDKGDSSKKKPEPTPPRERSSSRRLRGEEVPLSELKLTVSGRTRKRTELSEPEPKKPLKKATTPAPKDKEEKLTYESLGIESPENFDYENYPDVSLLLL